MSNLMIAAASSGSGKTTFTMGLLRALRNRGLVVQPYKCGPDYIDTKWHTLAAGRESVNLDIWMGGKEHVRTVFGKYSEGAEVCVTEGAMGMFDGHDRAHGSSAEVAGVTGAKTILVVNAKSAAYSVAPIIYGFCCFSRKYGTEIAGVVFNQMASESHYAFLKEACQDAGVECFGYIKKEKDIELPSRHLGLTIDERFRVDSFIERVAGMVEQTVEIDKILQAVSMPLEHRTEYADAFHVGAVGSGFLPQAQKNCFPFFPELCLKRVAVADDEGFNFIYRANIDSLKALGAEIVFFSPCKDKALPEHVDLLYLPGGYPEFFLDELEANVSMRQSVREYIEQGGYAYAECGGMLYLCRYITGMEGRCHEMVGVLDLAATFDGMRLHLGYRELRACGGTDSADLRIRGHEFHYSDILAGESVMPSVGIQYSAKGKEMGTTLFRYKNLIAGYTHFYWAAGIF
ncbi:MAG: cobyrinate a,c-diamide synthase [Roseburia sp.]|nr:cobyrinate a,c-diamide synthase [Roseburia sp.]